MVVRSLLWLTFSAGVSVAMANSDSAPRTLQAQPQPGQSMVGAAVAGRVDNALRHAIGLAAEHSSSAQPVALAALAAKKADAHAAAVAKHAAAEAKHAAVTAALKHQPGGSIIGDAAAATIDTAFRQITGVGAEHKPAKKSAKHAAADAAAAINPHQPGDSILGHAAAAKMDSTFRQVIGHSAPPDAAAAKKSAAHAAKHIAADAAAATNPHQPGESMLGHAAAATIDSTFRQVMGHSSPDPPAAAVAVADVANQQQQPGDSMVGHAAAEKINTAFRQVIGPKSSAQPAAAAPAKKSAAHIARDAAAAKTAKHNSSVPVGTPHRNASSGVLHPTPKKADAKKESFRELSPTAAKADHVYKAAATARSKAFKRQDTDSDESTSVCPTDHLAAAINAPTHFKDQAEQAISAEVYLFWLVVLGGGVVIAFLGETLLKPSLFVVGLFGGFFGMMVVLELMMQQGVDFADTYCWLPPTLALAGGIVSGLFALWLLSTAIFFLGAIVGLSGSYFVLNLAPVNWGKVGAGPLVLEQLLFPYWLVLLLVPLITGSIAKKKEAPLILAATAVVGGLAVGLSSRGLLATAGLHMPHWGMAMVAGAFALGGGAVQWFVMHPFAKLHRKRCGCGGKKKEEDEDPKVDLRRA